MSRDDAPSAPGREGLILQPTYRMQRGLPVLQIFGKLDDGEPFLVEEDRFRPYFFVRTADAERLAREPELELHASDLRTLRGDAVTQVVAPAPGKVPPVRDRLEAEGVPTFEADIRFPYRFLIDRGVRAAVRITGEGRRRDGLLRFRNPRLEPGDARPMLTALSIDLETTLDASLIFSAAIVATREDGKVIEEVHVVHDRPIDVPQARIHSSEAHLLIAVTSRIRELDPDLIVGWNVVDFDLLVLTRRCEALGLPAKECRLGRTTGAVGFLQDPGFTRQSRAEIPGRVVLDGIALVRDALRLEDYRLETVARAVLGRGKKIDHEAPDAGEEIQRLYREEPEALVAYNLEDARLVLEILEHEGLIDLTLERSLLSGMQMDRVGASIASFDLLYLPELRKQGIVAPSVRRDEKGQPIQGGAVLDAVAGVLPGVAVFDFKSLYPSLMRTFNLDPLALARAEALPEDECTLAPNGARFSREPAILPGVIERFMERRQAARDRGASHADQAIKIMMNALFGVFAAPSCRFCDARLANAITGFGQQTLAWTRDAFEEGGDRVVYGDTDSVFVQLDERWGDPAALRGARFERAESLRGQVETRIGARIRECYGVEPKLTLELEKIYDRLFLPHVRGGGGASKKRYAGVEGEHLTIVGLEAVRRDWPAVAGRLQRGMFERLFADDSHASVMPFVRELVEQVQAGACDDELVYVKRVRKRKLESYTAGAPPHVQAARKQEARFGKSPQIVRYVIARSGPEPVLPGGEIPDDIDRRHYVEKVLRPIAEAILVEIGQSFDEAMGEPRQLDLL